MAFCSGVHQFNDNDDNYNDLSDNMELAEWKIIMLNSCVIYGWKSKWSLEFWEQKMRILTK